MSEMVERACKAALSDGFVCNEDDIRAALLAALDPEDEALVEFVAKAHAAEIGIPEGEYPRTGEPFWKDMMGCARTSIAALKAATQGETTP